MNLYPLPPDFRTSDSVQLEPMFKAPQAHFKRSGIARRHKRLERKKSGLLWANPELLISRYRLFSRYSHVLGIVSKNNRRKLARGFIAIAPRGATRKEGDVIHVQVKGSGQGSRVSAD